MNDEGESREEMKRWRKVMKIVGDWLALKNKDEWLKDMRGIISLMATVISTMTFQSAINPPGGVRAPNDSGVVQCPKNRPDTINPCPGESILAVVYRDEYTFFLFSNTICFISSLAVCLLLVSGLPLNNRFFTWLLSIAMCITLTSLTLTYMFAMKMVTPHHVLGSSSIFYFEAVICIWISLLGLVTLLLCLRLIVWIVTECIARRKR